MNDAGQPRFDISDDDATIEAALQDASLLDGTVRPAGVYINEYQGYMS